MPDRSADRAHVVILTAGARPGDPVPDPRATQLAAVPALRDALARLHELGVHGADPGIDAAVGAALDAVATAYWRAGWADAARDHRVVAAWVIPGDRAGADRFAAFVTREIDPAFVATAMDPADELLRHGENARLPALGEATGP